MQTCHAAHQDTPFFPHFSDMVLCIPRYFFSFLYQYMYMVHGYMLPWAYFRVRALLRAKSVDVVRMGVILGMGAISSGLVYGILRYAHTTD